MFDTVQLESDDYQQIGGALWVLGFGLIFNAAQTAWGALSLLDFITGDSWEVLTTPGAESYHPLWKPLVVGELLVGLALLPYLCGLIVYFSQRRRAFPTLAILGFIVCLIAGLVDHAITSRIPDAVKWGNYANATQNIVWQACGAAFWTPYLIFSIRSKRTFVH